MERRGRAMTLDAGRRRPVHQLSMGQPVRSEPMPVEPVDEPDVPSPAAYRAGMVLALMGRSHETLTITEISVQLGLPKSSVSNLLTSLAAANMVRRGPKGWHLAYRVLELGHSMLISADLVTEFRRAVATLPLLSGETTLLAVLDGLDVVYVARNDGFQPVRILNETGSRTPAVVTALGKAMLAQLDPDDLDHRLSRVGKMPQPTPRSHRTVGALRADLATIRERGYSIDDEQGVAGVICLGVSVTTEPTPTAVSVTMISRRATPDFLPKLVSELTTVARRLYEVDQL